MSSTNKNENLHARHGHNGHFILARMAVAIAFTLFGYQAQADDTFNIKALEIDNPSSTPVDLSLFSNEGGQAPGRYNVDIFMNGEKQTTQYVTFVSGADGKLLPQLTTTQLAQWGVKVSSTPALAGLAKEEVVTQLDRYIPQASSEFDFRHLKLNISVPQASMNQVAQGEVDPSLWDDGISALLFSYSFSGGNTRTEGSSGTDDNYFLNLHSGANLGGWRLRNYSTWSYSQSSGSNQAAQNHWESINSWIQHDIKALRGQFIAGDSYTPSDVFDSLQFRGAQIASDDDMLPESLKGFAPTIRGIANSNARVTVSQNGNIIYQSYVPPGAFTITDLYPTAASGELEVTIREADGSERKFFQPFSNVPIMQREGRLKYAITTGKYRATNNNIDEPIFGQISLLYGLPHDLTVYGGVQTSKVFNSAALGLGMSLGNFGSISLDATQSWTDGGSDEANHDSKQGQSYRFQYSKDIDATDSTITLAGYRYSTKGFYSFEEALDYQEHQDDNSLQTDIHNNKRSKLQIDLTQSLMGGKWGSLSFSGYQQDYWNEEGYERNLNVSYSNSWESISWTLMLSHTEYANSQASANDQLSLNVSIPLSKWLPGTYSYTSMTNDLHGRSTSQLGLSGTALEQNNLSYSLTQGNGNHGVGYNASMTADYRGTYGEMNGGYSYSKDSKQINYGAQGTVIVHQHGVTFGQATSGDISALALVEAPGAKDVNVQSGSGIRTDWQGYTIVPYLSPYKRSRIGLDTNSMADDVDLTQNVTAVIPTAGAIVPAHFSTHIGSRVLMNLMMNGKAVPFGATVTLDEAEDTSDARAGIVGEEGQVYLSGVPDSGRLTARWGNSGSEQCHAPFRLPKVDDPKKSGIQQINVNCEKV